MDIKLLTDSIAQRISRVENTLADCATSKSLGLNRLDNIVEKIASIKQSLVTLKRSEWINTVAVAQLHVSFSDRIIGATEKLTKLQRELAINSGNNIQSDWIYNVSADDKLRSELFTTINMCQTAKRLIDEDKVRKEEDFELISKARDRLSLCENMADTYDFFSRADYDNFNNTFIEYYGEQTPVVSTTTFVQPSLWTTSKKA